MGLGACDRDEREDATHRSCSASVCNVMSAAVCRYFCTAFTVRVVQSAVFLYNTGLILVRCAPMVDAWVASLGAMHFYATNSRPLQLLARAEEAAGSALVPKPFEGLVARTNRPGAAQTRTHLGCGCRSSVSVLRAVRRETRLLNRNSSSTGTPLNACVPCLSSVRAVAPLRSQQRRSPEAAASPSAHRSSTTARREGTGCTPTGSASMPSSSTA